MKGNSRWVRFFRLLWPAAALSYVVVSAAAYVTAPWGDLFGEQLLIVPVWTLVTVLVSLGVAGLLYWRAPDNSVALHMAFFLLGWGLVFGGPGEMLAPSFSRFAESLGAAVGSLTLELLLPSLLLRFPNGRVEPRWARVLLVLVIATGALIVVDELVGVFPDSLSASIESINEFLSILPLFLSVWRYIFRATHSERQQMKWVLYGVVAFFIMALLANTSVPQPFASGVWFAAVMAIPVCFGIAVLRYRLWDVDLVIRRTVQYAAVTAVLGAVYFGTVVLMQRGLVALTGQESPLAVVVSTLVIAALFNPVRRRLQQWVDRAFNRKSYDAEQTLAQFSQAMRDEVDLDQMTGNLVEIVEETMQPTRIGLWLASESDTPGSAV